MPEPRSLNGSVVVVVGASGVLGAAIAHLLAAKGCHVVAAGPHPDRLLAAAIPGAVVVEVDLRDAGAGDRLVSEVMSRFGRLDGVVNAAGIVGFGALTDTDDVAIEELFLTNVIGPLWLLRRVIPMLGSSKGFIVNISAVVAEQPLPGMASYAASKAALSAADRALARELRPLGIHVCDARPPHTETGLATRAVSGQAPKLPTGLDPAAVAARIVLAIEQNEREVGSDQFG
jgi:NAD(P)-dependent dehydrogenase (short-subunit alcohol dehydrogenase family)